MSGINSYKFKSLDGGLSLFFYRRYQMELWLTIGGFSGIAAIIGFIGLLIKIGEWKAQVDTLRDRLKDNGNKTEALALMQNQQNVLLAEIKVKLDLLLEEKKKKRSKAND